VGVLGQFSASGAGQCTDCQAGQFSASGAVSCSTCSAGQISSVGATSCSACKAGKYSEPGSGVCKQCSGFRTSPTNSSISDCVGDGTLTLELWLALAYAGIHLLAYVAFVVTAPEFSYYPAVGLTYAAWFMVEVALFDEIMDLHYYMKNPFADEALQTCCLSFLIIPQIFPACLCFAYEVCFPLWKDGRIPLAADVSLWLWGALWAYPFGWKKEDCHNLFYAIVTLLYNMIFRPVKSAFMVVFLIIFWNMKLLSALLIQANEEENALRLLGLMVYNELIIENLPQFCIQFANNTALGTWSTIAIVSILSSSFFIFKGLFEPTFKFCVLGESCADTFNWFGSNAKVVPMVDQVVNATLNAAIGTTSRTDPLVPFSEREGDRLQQLKEQERVAVEAKNFTEADRLKKRIEKEEEKRRIEEQAAKEKQTNLSQLETELAEAVEKRDYAAANSLQTRINNITAT